MQITNHNQIQHDEGGSISFRGLEDFAFFDYNPQVLKERVGKYLDTNSRFMLLHTIQDKWKDRDVWIARIINLDLANVSKENETRND